MSRMSTTGLLITAWVSAYSHLQLHARVDEHQPLPWLLVFFLPQARRTPCQHATVKLGCGATGHYNGLPCISRIGAAEDIGA